MKKTIIYSTLLTVLFSINLIAQETFEAKAKAIAEKIENITKEEKNTLKGEIEEINIQFENKTLTKEQADLKKQELAKARAIIIENRIAVVQAELNTLVQEKVDGKIQEQNHIVETSENIFGKRLSLKFEDDIIKKEIKQHHEKRTTTQFVFATGLNNLVTDNSIDNSDFKLMGSHFYEWGITYKTRIAENNNLLHLKYGFSVMYNNLRPKNNNFFVVNGGQTDLENYPTPLKDARFKNVYLVAPLHLEFDFSGNTSRNENHKFRTQKSARLGLGGYAGFLLKTKQILEYEIDNRNGAEKIKGDYNANDFIYGLSSYIGYKDISLYLKYDLNPLFDNNPIKQNNVSLGLRFDWN